MTMVTRGTGSGLLAVEMTVGEAQLQRALKDIDWRLGLWPPDATSRYYRVVHFVSDWQPCEIVCTWMDPVTREPLPLSSGLIDKVNRMRRDNPYGIEPDADEHNERRVQEIERMRAERGQQIIDDHKAGIARGRVAVSLADRGRPDYLRNRRPPRSAGFEKP